MRDDGKRIWDVVPSEPITDGKISTHWFLLVVMIGYGRTDYVWLG